MKIYSLLLAILVAGTVGCASEPKTKDESPDASDMGVLIPKKSKGGRVADEPDEVSIDYLGLHRSLGLERPKEDLGYVEKSFATCDVGYGYSSSKNCRRDYFVVVHFQILCRDSEGTISTALGADDLKPLSGRTLNWSFPGARGSMQLDGEGYGQIKTTFANSQRLQRLKLAVDNDFVYVRAGEAKRLVTPRNWCN